MIRHSEERVLLKTRWMAAGALCLAAWFAIRELRSITEHRLPTADWIHEFDGTLPPWTGIALQILMYAIVVLYSIQILHESKGCERAYAAIFLSEVLLDPVRYFIPDRAGMAVLWLHAAGYVAMTAAALILFFSIGAPRSRPETQPPG